MSTHAKASASQMNTGPFNLGLHESGPLSIRLQALHNHLLLTVPCVDRIACALYDADEDLLRTFINSTRSGEAITGYQYKLSESASLSKIADTGEFRVVDDIPQVVSGGPAHSGWLLKQGYRSSFTVPIYDNGAFFGLIFFDSLTPAAFTPSVQRDLALYCNLINMIISGELAVIRSLVGAAQIARDFANLRDFETGAHLERMARYSQLIAKELAQKHALTDEFIEHIYLFAPLHDIGKIGIPDLVLLKAGKLDPQQREVMETHVEKGGEIVERIIGDFGLQQLADSQVLRNIVCCHHEMMDGSGYPLGLAGADVPIEARIVTTADIFDALTSKRPYKEAWSVEDALAELRKMVREGKLDSDCVEAMAHVAADVLHIQNKYRDTEG